MKLAYLTTVRMPATDAQSLQVAAMNRAFFDALEYDMMLCSPATIENQTASTVYPWTRIAVGSARMPRPVRYGLFVLGSILHMRRFQPDAIYTRDIGVAFVYSMFTRTRCIYEMHKPFETRIGKWLFTQILDQIGVVTISHALARHVHKEYGGRAGKTCVAHDGVFLDSFAPHRISSRDDVRAEYGLSDIRGPLALYTGSFQPGKGIDVILSLAKAFPSVTFVLAGGVPLDDIPENIRCIGRIARARIPELLAAADVLLLPNTRALPYADYTSPLKLFEYMASGVPIFASTVGSLTEVVSERNAFLFDPAKKEAMHRAFQSLLDNSAEQQKRAAEALQDVQQYTWDERVRRIMAYITS